MKSETDREREQEAAKRNREYMEQNCIGWVEKTQKEHAITKSLSVQISEAKWIIRQAILGQGEGLSVAAVVNALEQIGNELKAISQQVTPADVIMTKYGLTAYGEIVEKR